jgi:hypothetical protein
VRLECGGKLLWVLVLVDLSLCEDIDEQVTVPLDLHAIYALVFRSSAYWDICLPFSQLEKSSPLGEHQVLDSLRFLRLLRLVISLVVGHVV